MNHRLRLERIFSTTCSGRQAGRSFLGSLVRRKLRVELLEDRRLLAGDTLALSPAWIENVETTAPAQVYWQQVEPGGVQVNSFQSGPLINLPKFQADARFAGIDGTGFSSVIIDSGIDLDHPFFGPDADFNGVADRIVFHYDFTGANDADASDFDGHGSNVSSIVASQDATFPGIAPGTNIIALKVFNDLGRAEDSFETDLREALQWVVANVATYNIASVNLSLGDITNHNTPTMGYASAELAALAAQNVIVAAAAGNDYFLFQAQGVIYPAADPSVIAVGTVWNGDNGLYDEGFGPIDYTTGTDRIVSFSQRSTRIPMVFAPGSYVTGANQSGGTVSFPGTSQATPQVAGIATLAQQLATQALGRRLTLAEFSSLVISTGVSIFDGDDEDDNVRNTYRSYRRVDLLALGEAILAMAAPPGPEIDVHGKETSIADGDASPSTVDGTDFGSQNVSEGEVTRTFTIVNSGRDALKLTGHPAVKVVGVDGAAGASDFTVIAQPSTSIASGGFTTFKIAFDPRSSGLRKAKIIIATNDSDENPYDFVVQGMGVTNYGREIEIRSNDVVIFNADDTPNLADLTDFGSQSIPGGWVTREFEIVNLGSSSLSLNGSPRVKVLAVNGAPGASDFKIVQQPSSSVDGGGRTTFKVAFDPSAVGLRQATLSISSNDSDENPYTFVVQGTGIDAPEIEVRSSGVTIADGDTTPDKEDQTEFGDQSIWVGYEMRTFTIANVGTLPLDLTDSPLVRVSGPAEVDFFVAQPASSTIAPGGSLTFDVTFSPSKAGVRRATISIVSSDGDESPYNFTIQGTGTDDHGETLATATYFLPGTEIATIGDGPKGSKDVDLFVFYAEAHRKVTIKTWLPPGGEAFDSYLRLFDEYGKQVAYDDDSGPGLYSRIANFTTPNAGVYYVGVSDYENRRYNPVTGGNQTSGEKGDYVLSIEVATTADFNGDGAVTAADLADWRVGFGESTSGDADGDNDADGFDFLVWQSRFGAGASGAAAQNVAAAKLASNEVVRSASQFDLFAAGEPTEIPASLSSKSPGGVDAAFSVHWIPLRGNTDGSASARREKRFAPYRPEHVAKVGMTFHSAGVIQRAGETTRMSATVGDTTNDVDSAFAELDGLLAGIPRLLQN